MRHSSLNLFLGIDTSLVANRSFDVWYVGTLTFVIVHAFTQNNNTMVNAQDRPYLVGCNSFAN